MSQQAPQAPDYEAPDLQAPNTLPGEGPEEVPDTKVLKAVVIILGVLIIFAFIALIGGVFYELSREPDPEDAAAAQPMTVTPLEAPISLPPGASVSHMALDGNRIALHLSYSRSDKPDEILVVDLTTGAVIAVLRPEAD